MFSILRKFPMPSSHVDILVRAIQTFALHSSSQLMDANTDSRLFFKVMINEY